MSMLRFVVKALAALTVMAVSATTTHAGANWGEYTPLVELIVKNGVKVEPAGFYRFRFIPGPDIIGRMEHEGQLPLGSFLFNVEARERDNGTGQLVVSRWQVNRDLWYLHPENLPPEYTREIFKGSGTSVEELLSHRFWGPTPLAVYGIEHLVLEFLPDGVYEASYLMHYPRSWDPRETFSLEELEKGEVDTHLVIGREFVCRDARLIKGELEYAETCLEPAEPGDKASAAMRAAWNLEAVVSYLMPPQPRIYQ